MVTKVLFICTGNVDRSKTAEEMYKGADGLEVRSAGVSGTATAPLTKTLVEWADRIFVMEHKHQKAVLQLDPEAWNKVECLGILDIFHHGQPELKRLLAEKLTPHLGSPPKTSWHQRAS